MSKSKLNIELDRTEINKDAIPEASLDELYDGVGYERDREETFKESKKEMKFKKKGIWQSINLNIVDGLRLVERYFNKWLGYLVGNNENPIPTIPNFALTKPNIIYIIIIVVLLILLWIK